MRPMKHSRTPTWIVVADQARARLFRYGLEDGGLEEVEDIVHLNARLPVHERETDRGGMTGGGGGGGHRDAFDPRAAAHRGARTEFAHAISERLETKRKAGELGGFYLVAEPRFLGDLRLALSDPLMQRLRGEVAHRAVLDTGDEIRALLPNRL
jgi:protein required for attachment to host cells